MAALRRLALALVLAAAVGCLGHADEDPEAPGSLASGSLQLEAFPLDAQGIIGPGMYCRIAAECGCPILSPDDVEACRQDMAFMDEETCQIMLQRAVPECLP